MLFSANVIFNSIDIETQSDGTVLTQGKRKKDKEKTKEMTFFGENIWNYVLIFIFLHSFDYQDRQNHDASEKL